MIRKTTFITAAALLILGIVSAAPVFSLAPPDRNTLSLHDKLRDAVYNYESSEGEITRLYTAALSGVSSSSLDPMSKSYWLSRVEYLIGRWYQNRDDKDKSAARYDEALAHIETSLGFGDYSEGFRMKSELISQMCLVKGVGFILANGLKVNEFAEKALKLNPDNGKAIIIVASSKVYPPPIYGGNPRKGMDLMLEAQTKPDIEKDDLFNIYSGVGVAYGKLKDREKSMFWLENALDLYPNNTFVREEYSKIKR